MKKRRPKIKDKFIYVFDLDGTICKWNKTKSFPNGRAEDATPLPKRINKVNRLYDKGHTIIIDTARGSVTGKDQTELTKKQLKEWGVKYHELRVGTKTYGDWYIDDKAISDREFFK